MPESGAGAGVRVAVIDSGAHPGHPHIGRIAGGIAIGPDGAIAEGEAAWCDRLGHGTAVLAAIQEKAPAAEYHVVRVFHDALRTRAATLLHAIDWCIAARIDVANLSLGTVNPAHVVAFAAAAARARAAGCLLVAAHEADGVACLPGSLPDVLGVGLDWDCPRDGYRIGDAPGGPAFVASGYPRPAPGVPPRRNLHGISFAVANMSGFVARACAGPGEGADRFEGVRARLAAGGAAG